MSFKPDLSKQVQVVNFFTQNKKQNHLVLIFNEYYRISDVHLNYIVSKVNKSIGL